MKLHHLLLPALIPLSLHAATLTVLPGTSIQTKIPLAVPGDIVAIFGGESGFQFPG